MTALAIVTTGAGFLLAVLWFDLMFDVQVLRHREADVLPEPVLGSISAYYRRVTTTARPMNRLVAAAMLAVLVATIAEIAGDDVPGWAAWLSLALAAGPISLAGLRTVPAAVRLGGRADPPAKQTALARAILRDHVACFAGIATLIAIQIGGAA